MKELSDIIASKLVLLRKANNLTQLELAEKLNYSDKAISKWEHGDSLPPVEILYSIAELYGTTMDYLVTEYDGENVPCIELEKKPDPDYVRKICVMLLGISIVYFIATFIFIYLRLLMEKNFWQIFIYAIPFSCIVSLVFNSLWGKQIFMFIILSIFVWAVLLSFYVALLPFNVWPIFIIGAPAEIIIFLCAGIRTKKHVVKNKNNK